MFNNKFNIIDTCPNCGREYDEIDADYLIYHLCGYDANKEKNQKTKQLTRKHEEQQYL